MEQPKWSDLEYQAFFQGDRASGPGWMTRRVIYQRCTGDGKSQLVIQSHTLSLALGVTDHNALHFEAAILLPQATASSRAYSQSG